MLLSKMYESCHSNYIGASIRFFTGGHHYIKNYKKGRKSAKAEEPC